MRIFKSDNIGNGYSFGPVSIYSLRLIQTIGCRHSLDDNIKRFDSYNHKFYCIE